VTNICAHFADACAHAPEAVFLQLPDDGGEHSFAVMERRTAQLAGALRAQGIAADSRVMVQAAKSPDMAALYLAVLRLGAIFIPLNTAYTAAELQYFIADAAPHLLVCAPAAAPSVMALCAEAKTGTEVRTLGDATSPQALERAAEQAEPIAQIASRSDADLAALLYTSGTTGRPKGAMLSHGNLASNAVVLRSLWAFRAEDVLLHALPLFHVHGLFVAMHCALLAACRVLLLPKFDLAQIKRGLRQASVMMGVPTFYSRLLADPEFGAADCARMRLFISGSAPLSAPLHRDWLARTGHRILERYGMTELGMVASNPYAGERIAGTVGYALPGIAVRVADADGQELPRDSIGTLEVKGPNVFRGYWQRPTETAAEFRADGYFITGDLATMAADGRIAIVGRAKDLIITGGYNVYPKEIETLLDAMPQVAESAVIGLPHPDFGESVCAIVVAADPALSAAEVRRALGGKLAKFKQPSRVELVDSLPRNALGKVQKNVLRARYG